MKCNETRQMTEKNLREKRRSAGNDLSRVSPGKRTGHQVRKISIPANEDEEPSMEIGHYDI